MNSGEFGSGALDTSLSAASKSGSLPPLPKPARPAQYYCNKCGAYPTSEVHMAFRPTLSIRCHHLAAEINPSTYTADQMRAYAASAMSTGATAVSEALRPDDQTPNGGTQS
jgi:hypothetical protein